MRGHHGVEPLLASAAASSSELRVQKSVGQGFTFSCCKQQEMTDDDALCGADSVMEGRGTHG